MKFPRNAKILRGHLDVTPFAAVFFCLLIFLILGSLFYMPGVHVNLPQTSSALPGVRGPALAVAVDASGRLFLENQVVQATNLQVRLKREAARQSEPLTLVVLADKAVTQDQLSHLYDLALSAGVRQIHLAMQPRAFDSHVP